MRLSRRFRITEVAIRCHMPSNALIRPSGRRPAWMRGPSATNSAGRNVSAATTANSTTIVPPSPMVARKDPLKKYRLLNPIATANPEKTTAWPAVSSAVTSASA